MYQSYKQNDYVHFSVVCHNPSGGALAAADSTPWFRVEKMNALSPTQVLTGNLSANAMMVGRYDGYFYTSGTMFDEDAHYQVWVSGTVVGTSDIMPVKSFIVKNAPDVNVTRVSGQFVNGNDFGSNLYYANIKFNKDVINSRDEYTVNWFKNSRPLSSGNFTNPALTVCRTDNGTAIFANQQMTYANSSIGVVRYNDSVNLTASGESYLVIASSTIDGSSRRWEQLIGIDSL